MNGFFGSTFFSVFSFESLLLLKRLPNKPRAVVLVEQPVRDGVEKACDDDTRTITTRAITGKRLTCTMMEVKI
jgi:hypothetical protein